MFVPQFEMYSGVEKISSHTIIGTGILSEIITKLKKITKRHQKKRKRTTFVFLLKYCIGAYSLINE
jgi:hypothetical protein